MTVSLQRLKRMLGIVIFMMTISPSFAQADDINESELLSLSDTALPDLFSGTMGYQIPIEVLPGINGLQPTLALFYRSSNGNGWLSQGWELEMGAIERTTRNGVADYSANDYTLKRAGSSSDLIAVGNGIFRSKIESDFISVETSYCIDDLCSLNNPQYLQFIATNKSGVKYYFGSTGTRLSGDSGARIIGASGTFRWALGKIVDTNGNTMTFTYQSDGTGQVYPNQIKYNGNTLTFILEDRFSNSDFVNSTIAGFLIITKKRLKRIDMHSADGSLARSYQMDYHVGSCVKGIGVLASVKKIGKDGATADLQHTNTFEYSYFTNIGDVLTSISNGYGATIGISYIQPSVTQYISAPPNPIPLVVNEISKNDGNGNYINTTFAFDGGYYYSAEHDFRGFNHVTAKVPAGTNNHQITETWFHQGNDLAVDVNAPSVTNGYMKGKPYRVRISDNSGHIYSEAETIYAADKNGAAPWFNPPIQINTFVCDGLNATGSCKDKTGAKHFLKVYSFDADSTAEFGNLSYEYNYGDLDDPNDDFTIHRNYSPNVPKGIVSLPSNVTKYRGIGTTTPIASNNYYYDNVADCVTASTNPIPDRGNLTRVVRWLSYESNPDSTIEERMAYDSYGNQVCHRDANGNITHVVYDQSHTFPAYVINPPTQSTFIQYYGVDNVPADQGGYGQVKSITLPNGATTYFEYDLIGRKTKEVLPDNTWTRWEHDDLSRKNTVFNSALQWTVYYLDGLKRTSKIESNGPDAKTIRREIQYDSRGYVSQTSLPYFAEIETPRFQTFTYDAFGRVTKSDIPLIDASFTTDRYCYDCGVPVERHGNFPVCKVLAPS